MIESVLVPKQRIKVVMDKNCKVPLEEKLKVKLSFNQNNVIIDGEGLDLYQAKIIVKAIGRGFSPVHAFKLLEDDQELEIIDIPPKKLKVIRARLIGTRGKTRIKLEHFTKCFVSIFGKTISIIGGYTERENARYAIEMIIRGVPHNKVYRYLEEIKNE